ncbi:ankyrin repeat domain-containing protein [Fusarium mexicanum]|uniref:Ankyrin repeat domain-containing protein n=1 Tax=Fusarium mexicanum TaxID=751941 RepID=A0A8H5IID2_9HYPO|nr:ankyrin repeat domain-containing protein [Fusarium mexicanum]
MHSTNPQNILDAARLVSQSALSNRERRIPFSNIPLIVHQTWKTTAADTWDPRILPWVELWLENSIYVHSGPSMAYLFWDDTGMRGFVEQYENDFLERYDSLLTPVERSDVFRILVCKHFGGIYADLDTELIRHPAAWISGSDIATWTDPKTGKTHGYYNTSGTPDYETPVVSLLWGLEADNDPESDAYWRRSYTYPQQLSQWAFAAAPQHPVFERYMDNLRYCTRDNETAAQNSDPLKRTGPAAVTLATKSWLEDDVDFRWTSLTGVKDGGKSKLVEDILILPITGFHPSHGSRNDLMGRKPITDPAARLCHHGTGLWKHFNFVGEYGKAAKTNLNPNPEYGYRNRTEMAEVLGIVSGAAGLLSLAIEVTKLSYTYIASVRGAPKSLTSYIGELATLTSVLSQLKDLIQANRFNGQNSQALSKALHDCQLEVEHLKAKLEKKLSYGRLKAKVAALAWPLSESELLEKVNMLHRYNGILSSALQADTLTVAIATNKELQDIRQSTEAKEIIAWYKWDVPAEASTSHLDDYCPSTWQTFLSGSFYQSWRSGSTPVVWGYGQPGDGKTVLAALVLRHVKSANLPGTAIASHFFSSSRPKETVSNVLRSFIAQALNGCPVIPQEASALYEKGSQNLMVIDLVGVLGAIAKSMTMCIILDGLDECPFLPKLFNILSTLQDLGVRIFTTARDLPKIRKHFEKKPRVEISATRQDLDFYVNHRLEHGEVDVESIGLELKLELVSAIMKRVAGSFLLARLIMDHITSLLTIKDIRKALASLPANYNEAYLSTFDRIVKQTPNLRDLALKSLNFISYVKEPLRMVELQHALSVEEGMGEVDPEDLQPSKAIISSCLGLLVVSGPEKIVEFVHSTARDFLQSRPEEIDKRPHLTIVRSCISYMSTNEMRQGRCLSHEDVIQRCQKQPFLHYAANFYGYHAQEVEDECSDQLSRFLENDALRDSSWQLLNFKAHLDTSVSESMFASSPRNVLALHVASFWGFKTYIERSLSYTQHETPSTQIHNLNKNDSHGWTPLHWAVSMGHESIVEILLRSGASPDLPDIAGWTPTFWAAFKGHADIIEMLWRYDTAPFRCDVKGLTPLHWAVSAGQTEIVKRLLNLKTRFAQYGTSPVLSLPSLDDLTVERARAMTTRANESPFKFYSEGTDIEMFSAIFNALKQSFREKEDRPRERGEGFYTFDPFLYGPFGQSLKADYGRRARPDRDYQWGKPDVGFLEFVDKLLIHATRSQDLPIIRLVFDLKLVKPSGIGSLALLHEAAASGWVEGMAALIDLGADVNNAERSFKQTPLHRACQNQQEEAVKLLLGIDKIDTNAQASDGRTPIMNLMTASYEEKGVNLYKLLVSSGASISIQDTEGNSLMHYALRTCNATIVQMLCTAGLSIESPNKSGQLPLHWMAHWKYFDLRKPVTPDEVQDVRKKRRDCMKLVFQLSSLGSLDSVCDWETGATLSRQTPLSLALKSHNWDIAAELLKHIKEPVNMRSLLDPYHSIVNELCMVSERLAAVSTPGSRDRTMLYYELQPLPSDDWTSILEMLLHAGADINKTDWDSNTPLQLCVQRAASIPVIDTLLKLGASPYQAGKGGLDCFHLALMSCDEAGSWDIMRCLRIYANTHPDPSHYFCQGGFLIAAETPIDNEQTRYLQVLRQTNAINCETRSGRTLIYEAASRGNTRLVQRLLEHDAYACYIDGSGSSALHAAAKQQAPATVAVLLEAGADVHQASMDEHGSTVTGTPLHVCLEACNGGEIKSETVETVRILLSYGTDPNYAAVKDGHTETILSLTLKSLCQSIYYPNLDAIPSEDSDHLLLEVLKLLIGAGARVAESADDIIVGVVAKMEGHESLWEEMRSQLVPRSHALNLGAE